MLLFSINVVTFTRSTRPRAFVINIVDRRNSGGINMGMHSSTNASTGHISGVTRNAAIGIVKDGGSVTSAIGASAGRICV